MVSFLVLLLDPILLSSLYWTKSAKSSAIALKKFLISFGEASENGLHTLEMFIQAIKTLLAGDGDGPI